MTRNGTSRSATSKLKTHSPPRLRSVLVPVDLTALSDRVVARVALLPMAEQAQITLLHVGPAGLPRRDPRQAARAAAETLAEEAMDLAQAFPRTVHIGTTVSVGSAAIQIAAKARATKADLVVMGRGGRRALRDAYLGSTAERVIRRGACPVLAVRRGARGRYRHPALAPNLDRTAGDAIGMMLRLLPHPRPFLAVLHAVDPPYHGLAYHSLHRDEHAERCRELEGEATRKLKKFLSVALDRRVRAGEAPMWRTHVRYGSPRLVIERLVQSLRTDLLVLGTHAYTGLAHAFLGTVAGDVLREVACDVVVVPPRNPRA